MKLIMKLNRMDEYSSTPKEFNLDRGVFFALDGMIFIP
jgi:hypothetical protein